MQQPVVAAPGPQVTAINIGGMGMEGHGRKMYRREANHLGKLGMESHVNLEWDAVCKKKAPFRS